MSGRGSEAPALSIVVPVYNGAATIGALVDALERLDIEGGHEIVLVNDASPDDSLAKCLDLARAAGAVPVTVIDHGRNFGEHAAVMTGLRHARGAFVITMDDDLQNPPEEVARLHAFTRDGDFDVVFTRYARKEHEAWRNLGSRFANRVADLMLDKPRGLYLSSFRCISRFAVDQIIRYDGPFPYIDGLILQATQRIGSLEVAHLPRSTGRSNYTLRRLVRLWLNLALNFSVLPLRIATAAGLVTGTLGLVGVLLVVAEALSGTTPEGWASTLAIVLLVAGVQLIMLGVVGEYLGRLYLTVNRKPQAAIRSVYRGDAGSGAATVTADTSGTIGADVAATGCGAAAAEPVVASERR